MSEGTFFVLGLLLAAIAGLAVPRWIAKFRLSRRVQRALVRERTETSRDSTHRADYQLAIADDSDPHGIDEATWRDLDMDAVFNALDFTESQVGHQYLYSLLRRPQLRPGALTTLEPAAQRFAGGNADTQHVREILGHLADPRAAHLARLLFGELPTRPRLWWIFPTLTITAVCCVALVLVWPRFGLLWLAVCIANIGIQLIYRPRVRSSVAAFQAIPNLVRVAQRLSTLDANAMESESIIFKTAATRLKALQRATTWLLFEPGTANEMVSTLYEYVNMLFLLDINAFVFSTTKIKDARPLLRELFEAVGRIDSAQSISRWRASLPHWVAPVFDPSTKALCSERLYHPLLATSIANSIEIRDGGILITGSNMSGKTTFMRTLGVNAILAQTLNTTCAATWHASCLRVRSSIGREDSLVDGKSHYFAEAESIRSLIAAKATTGQHLFLIDEIFRGTNTAERVAAAYGVLRYLSSRDDIVVVATHDIELRPLLGGAFASYHFRESVAGGAMSFDYILRPGHSSTRNAIALLAAMHFPASVIADATSVLNGQVVPVDGAADDV